MAEDAFGRFRRLRDNVPQERVALLDPPLMPVEAERSLADTTGESSPVADAPLVPSVGSVPGLLHHMHSTVLDCALWIMETDAQAQAQREAGHAAYSAREVWLLREMKQRQPDGYDEKLRTIHQCQEVFTAMIERIEPPIASE